MKKLLHLVIISILLFSCTSRNNEKTVDSSMEFVSEEIPTEYEKYYPLRLLLDSIGNFNLNLLDANGINGPDISLAFEKYKSDSLSVMKLLNKMNEIYYSDTLNNKFFKARYSKKYLCLDLVNAMKLDITFYSELEHIDHLLHYGYIVGNRQYFISVDTVNSIIYSNYHINKN